MVLSNFLPNKYSFLFPRWENKRTRQVGQVAFGVDCLEATNLPIKFPWLFVNGQLSSKFRQISILIKRPQNQLLAPVEHRTAGQAWNCKPCRCRHNRAKCAHAPSESSSWMARCHLPWKKSNEKWCHGMSRGRMKFK